MSIATAIAVASATTTAMATATISLPPSGTSSDHRVSSDRVILSDRHYYIALLYGAFFSLM
jgi:hypothetical protein